MTVVSLQLGLIYQRLFSAEVTPILASDYGPICKPWVNLANLPKDLEMSLIEKGPLPSARFLSACQDVTLHQSSKVVELGR